MARADDEDRASDILIQEVDDDLRRDQYLKLWKRYGGYLIGVAVAIVLAVAGYEGWQSWQERVRNEEAARFGAAQALEEAGKTKEAEDAYQKIAADAPPGFALLAGMRRADLLQKGGDAKAAESAYEQIEESGAPKELRDLAVIKASMLAIDTQSDLAPVEKRLAALTNAGNPWFYEANELLALVARKKGDAKRANDLFKQLADDPQAPQGIRARAAEMIAALSPAGQPASPAAATPPAATGTDKVAK